jgi:magnesium-transporting ATPase (P-type)
VSPFTSHTKSPMSVVDLLKEGSRSFLIVHHYHNHKVILNVTLFAVFLSIGRASLATSFANYKFLIMYGLLFSVVKLCSFYYGVLMSSMSYYCIDGIAITSLCYTMTLSEPVQMLSKQRPTASLLGPTTVASCLGIFIISFICLIASLMLMRNSPDYVKWPAEYSSSSDWWTLSDNWEATVLYVVMFLFLVCSAGIFSFGYKFRRPAVQNIPLVVNLSFLFIITTITLLMDANELSDMWHMASYHFNSEDSVSPVWTEYQLDGGHTSAAMTFDFRLKLYVLVMAFIVMSVFWQSFVMEGFIGDYLKAKYPIKVRAPIRF